MTLMASLAMLRDLGRAYWVHRYDSSWMAKICVCVCEGRRAKMQSHSQRQYGFMNITAVNGSSLRRGNVPVLKEG